MRCSYMMHAMVHATHSYLWWAKLGKVTLKTLAEVMECSIYGTYEYDKLLDHLKKSAKRNGCAIEELRFADYDEDLYNLVL